MKHNPVRTLTLSAPSEEDIRTYAYHLYQQGNSLPGHDLENWLEATACLKANIPSHRSVTRLHEHVNGPAAGESPMLVALATDLAS